MANNSQEHMRAANPWVGQTQVSEQDVPLDGGHALQQKRSLRKDDSAILTHLGTQLSVLAGAEASVPERLRGKPVFDGGGWICQGCKDGGGSCVAEEG
jgi:hypothetical protein